jgi:hypothetical protein
VLPDLLFFFSFQQTFKLYPVNRSSAPILLHHQVNPLQTTLVWD